MTAKIVPCPDWVRAAKEGKDAMDRWRLGEQKCCWMVRDRASTALDAYRGHPAALDGYNGSLLYTTVTCLPLFEVVQVTVVGPSPGACPTLIKWIAEAIGDMPCADRVRIGTQRT